MRVSGLDLSPPSCLSSVRASRAEGEQRERLVKAFVSDDDDAKSLAWHRSVGRSDESWTSIRDELEAWILGCACGEDVAKIYGVTDRGAFGAPVFHACTACGVRALVFDPTLHGYDARTSKRKPKARKAPDARVALHCRGCKATAWRPVVLVTYQGDADNYARDDGRPFEPLAEFFDVILIGGTCTTCGDVSFPYAAECA